VRFNVSGILPRSRSAGEVNTASIEFSNELGCGERCRPLRWRAEARLAVRRGREGLGFCVINMEIGEEFSLIRLIATCMGRRLKN
jgi:hypothetical protein